MTTIATLSTNETGANSLIDINANFVALNSGKAEKSGQVFTGAISATNLSGTNTGDQTLNGLLPAQTSNSGKFLTTDGSNTSWGAIVGANGGTVTTFSVASGNGFNGSVVNPTSTPALTISTTVTGVLKGNGTTMSAATAGTDYSVPSGTETLTNKTITTPTISKPVMSATNPSAQTYSPSAAATATLDLSLSNQHYINMPAGNITLALSNDTNNQIFLISIKQDTSGSRTVTWFAGISWTGGTVPTLTTTASKTDYFGFVRTGSSTYAGFIIGQSI